MKMKSFAFLSLVLPIVTVLALIGLTGCATVTSEALTPEPPTSEEVQPAPAEPPEGQLPGESTPGEVQITFTADRTNLQLGECATLQWDVQGGFGVELDGQPVERSGQTQVCPEEATAYWLDVDTGEIMERREVVISLAGGAEEPPQEPPPGESKYALARQFELPEGYVVEQLFEPLLPAPILARSQSGVIFVAHAGSKPGVSLLDPSSGQVTSILDLPEPVGGIIVGGPGDTAFIGMAGEIWQVSADGSHRVWGQRRDGGPWYYAPDGRLLGISNDWTRILELLPDGSSREVAKGFVEVNDVAVAADGTLFVADVKTGQVTALSPDGARRVVATVAPDALDIELDPEGNLFMNHVATGFVRVGLDSGDLFSYDAEHSSCRAISTPAGFVFPEPGLVIFQDFPASQVTWADLNTGEGGLLVSNQGVNTLATDIGPDDALYVGVSGCGDQIPAQVARLADDGTREIVVDGLRGEVHDIAFAPDGGLYIATRDPYLGEPVYYVPPEGGDPFEIPDTALRNIISLAVDPRSGHLLAGTELGGTSVLEFTLDGLLAEYPLDLPKKTMQFTLDIAHDGTLYAHASEAERFFTGPVVERWLLRLDLENGSTEIVAQVDLNGCCPLANLSTDPQGLVWWLLSPDFLLYRITPDGESTLFAQNLDWDPMSVAVDRQGDVYITMPHGIYRIYREP